MKINIKTFMCKKLCGCHPNNVCVVFVVSVIKVCVWFVSLYALNNKVVRRKGAFCKIQFRVLSVVVFVDEKKREKSVIVTLH